MGRKTVLLDDYDGTELPDDTAPVSLSLGRTTYSIYLSEANHGKLLEALNPFIEKAETVSATSTAQSKGTKTTKASGGSADKEKMKKVREWARSTNFKFKNAKGEEVGLGDRGRIPETVIKAYEEANE